MTAHALLERAISLGVRVVQYCDNLPLGQGDVQTLCTRAAEAGVCCEVGTRGTSPAHLHAMLTFARRMGSSIVRMITDTADDHPTADEIVRRISEVMPAYEGAGVALAIENHDRFTAQALVHMLKCIGSDHIGICLDTANSFAALEGPEVVVNTLAPWTLNLHVKDFVVLRSPHQLGFVIEGRAAGQGQLDLPWVLDMLQQAGRKPNVILELWTPLVGSLAETLRCEERWAVESLAYLRSLLPADSPQGDQS